MKIIFEGDMFEDKDTIDNMYKAQDYLLALAEIRLLLRPIWKYGTFENKELDEETYEKMCRLSDEINRIIAEAGADV